MITPKRQTVGRGNKKFGGKSDTITIRIPADPLIKQAIQKKIALILKPYLK